MHKVKIYLVLEWVLGLKVDELMGSWVHGLMG